MTQSAAVRSELDAQWESVCAKMRVEIGEAAYRSWLKPLAVAEVANGAVRLAVPTRFMRDWVVAHYAERLEALWRNENA
ncbi:MAG: chromosomal replication initiator protein DnaA, partial [Alphaproteobacteria bacterium]|nr:chromosomal replication initiator protein DnaA [Alphaproteobacteria bacterium]